jgi:hypothetical protein
MIWDSPGGTAAEVSALRRRVAGLERRLHEQQEEYRQACDQLAGAVDDLAQRLDDFIEATTAREGEITAGVTERLDCLSRNVGARIDDHNEMHRKAR